ncbi:hypothetical protein KIW84_024132, partial [Lathyrus oleraceus]
PTAHISYAFITTSFESNAHLSSYLSHFHSQPKHTHIMGLQEDFEEHAAKVKTLTESPSNENLLILYGLYKQATLGPVTTARPGIFSQKDRAKWDAWKAVEGKSKDEAMSDYITKVKQLLEEAGLSA